MGINVMGIKLVHDKGAPVVPRQPDPFTEVFTFNELTRRIARIADQDRTEAPARNLLRQALI